MKEILNNRLFLIAAILLGFAVTLGLLVFLVMGQNAGFRLEELQVTMEVGDSMEVPVKVPSGGTLPEIQFVSDNSGVVQVNKVGRITALREGTAQIVCSTESGQEEYLQVTVAKGGNEKDKVIYLTFEDGPSREVSLEVLEVLKECDATATFFAVGKEAKAYPDTLKQAVKDGHTIGVYTYESDYTALYESAASYLKDFNKAEDVMKTILGEKPVYWRFPGNAGNELISEEDKDAIMEDLHRRGLVCIDWNCYVQEHPGEVYTVKEMKNTGIKTIEFAIEAGKTPVVRLHDTRDDVDVAKVTKKIIRHFQKKGYQFCGLDHYTGPEILAAE